MTAFNKHVPPSCPARRPPRGRGRRASGTAQGGFDALQERSEIARETLTLQETPAGAFLLFWFDGDVEKAFASVIAGDDDFTVRHRAQLRKMTGIDLADRTDGGAPETLLDWSAPA